MTNKEAHKIICDMLSNKEIDATYKVALWKAEYIIKKLIKMERDLSEEYVDLLDVDYPSRNNYWDGYNKGYHDCEVEMQAKEKTNDGSDPKQSGEEE